MIAWREVRGATDHARTLIAWREVRGAKDHARTLVAWREVRGVTDHARTFIVWREGILMQASSSHGQHHLEHGQLIRGYDKRDVGLGNGRAGPAEWGGRPSGKGRRTGGMGR